MALLMGFPQGVHRNIYTHIFTDTDVGSRTWGIGFPITKGLFPGVNIFWTIIPWGLDWHVYPKP